MKEIVTSIVVVVVIAAAAAVSLNALDWSAQTQFTAERGNVRLR